MISREKALRHLLACYDAVYSSLGRGAPKITNDGVVVRLYEMGRAFGALALPIREELTITGSVPLPVLLDVLDEALAVDPTGALGVYAMSSVVGPRLLVTLRDIREHCAPDSSLTGHLDQGAQVSVREVRSLATRELDGFVTDDPHWQSAARGLVETLEKSGNAESFTFSR